jgi:hypothetical protein
VSFTLDDVAMTAVPLAAMGAPVAAAVVVVVVVLAALAVDFEPPR